MEITKVYCDHCGKDMNGSEAYTNIEIDCCNFLEHVDICEDCYEQLTKWIFNYFHKTKEKNK